MLLVVVVGVGCRRVTPQCEFFSNQTARLHTDETNKSIFLFPFHNTPKTYRHNNTTDSLVLVVELSIGIATSSQFRGRPATQFDKGV